MINSPATIALFKATWETIYMVFIASSLSIFFGALFGIILFLTREKQLFANKPIHQILGFIVNATRSIPFIILMISILPLTRLIIGTTIGIHAAIVPLTLTAIPFFARIFENALVEIPEGLLETAAALGMAPHQLIFKVLIPESLPALIRGATLTIIGLIGYSAMAGVVGGGGLGELAINYGYQRFDMTVTLETVIILIVMVQLLQWGGDRLAQRRKIKPVLYGSLFLAFVCIASRIWPLSPPAFDTLRVGVMTGWPQQIMQVAQQEALQRYHLHLKIVAFDDYILPNIALANGDIDANIFQHLPYLQAQIKSHGYKLIPIAKTFVYPMGFYSRKITSLTQLKPGTLVALPNDPSNEGRALLLLQKGGIIQLTQNVGVNATLRNIIANPQQLRFILLDAAQLPRALHDADLVALTNDYVKPAGFTLDQALLKENANSPYANIIVIRAADKNNPLWKELISVMHSKAVLQATENLFPHGGAIAAWNTTHRQ